MSVIPLADAPVLWTRSRRTRRLRLVLAATMLVLAGLAVAGSFSLHVRPTSYFASGGGLVVADFSRSIDPRAYRRMARVLRALADADQPIGLIAFSDDAYEMLPAGTRGDEVRPILRFFEGAGTGNAYDLTTQTTPWSNAFYGGTRIGNALGLARADLARTGTRGGTVLLVSDLADAPSDIPIVEDELSRYRKAGIHLRVVPLFPQARDLALFTTLAGAGAVVSGNEIVENSKVTERRSLVGSFPVWLAVAAGLLLVALAANEHLCRRLHWGSA